VGDLGYSLSVGHLASDGFRSVNDDYHNLRASGSVWLSVERVLISRTAPDCPQRSKAHRLSTTMRPPSRAVCTSLPSHRPFRTSSDSISSNGLGNCLCRRLWLTSADGFLFPPAIELLGATIPKINSTLNGATNDGFVYENPHALANGTVVISVVARYPSRSRLCGFRSAAFVVFERQTVPVHLPY
jgi:hypothetical protein